MWPKHFRRARPTSHAASVAAPVTDPHFASVVLLIDGDTAADLSSYERTVSPEGNAALTDTPAPEFGTNSLGIDSSVATQNNYYYCGTHSSLMLPGDFTFESRVYWQAAPNATNWNPVFMSIRGTLHLYTFSYFNGKLWWFWSTDGTNSNNVTVDWTPTEDTETPIALVKSGTSVYFFVGGEQVGATQTVGSHPTTGGTDVFKLFTDGANDTKFQGWMRQIRLTKGVARYTSNYTPATSAFPTS